MVAVISREQAGALAALARTVRPGWDQLATMNAILEVADRDLADVAHAVVRCTQDPEMRRPVSITFTDADHWRPTVIQTETVERRAERIGDQAAAAAETRRCGLCDLSGYLPNGARCAHDPAAEDRARSGAAGCRAALERVAS